MRYPGSLKVWLNDPRRCVVRIYQIIDAAVVLKNGRCKIRKLRETEVLPTNSGDRIGRIDGIGQRTPKPSITVGVESVFQLSAAFSGPLL
jgi:hypothetical protein